MKKVVFFGKTGVGKSSTLNSVFGLSLPTDNVIACTSEPYVFERTNSLGERVVVVDMPGISESIDADIKFEPIYRDFLSDASLIVWVLQADTRVYSADQASIIRLKEVFSESVRFVFCINQVDQINLGKWNYRNNMPSKSRMRVMNEIRLDVYKKFNKIVPSLLLDDILFNSNKTGYGNADILSVIMGS